MSELPAVSVIIPVYNVEKYLPKCLDSLLGQTMANIEAVCVDDASTDRSGKILEQYAARDGRVKFFSSDGNAGPDRARNLGLEKATGEYVMFCDPDDWFEPDAVETAYRRIAENGNDFAYFNTYIYMEDSGRQNADAHRLAPFAEVFGKPALRLHELTPPFIRTSESWYKIYRKKFLDENGIRFAGLRLCEDIPFFMKAVVSADTVSVEKRPLYYHLMRSNSLISDYSNWRDSLTAFKQGYEIIGGSEHAETFYRSFLPYCINSLIFWYNRFTAMNNKLRKDFYREMREFFRFIDERHDVGSLKNTKLDEFKRIVRRSWLRQRTGELFSRLFGVEKGVRHRTVIVCGIRIKMKNN